MACAGQASASHYLYQGEGIGLILGVELIGEEEGVNGMVMIGISNIVAISTMHTIKLNLSHHIWDLFHRRIT